MFVKKSGGVSKNNGTPKWMVKMIAIKMNDWGGGGVPIIFGNTYYVCVFRVHFKLPNLGGANLI